MKIDWHGTLTAVQPRFRLGRSFDQRHHEYLGYALRVVGEFEGKAGTAWLGVGKAAHEKHGFHVGQEVAGRAQPVTDPRYGPKSCRFYRPGPTRKVPGRRGMSFDEGDWVDEQETEHRGPDD